MKTPGRASVLLAVSLPGICFLLQPGLSAQSITITPSNPSVLAGQSIQLSATGAVTPAEITAGEWHTCALFADQTVRCTGRNNFGQIGDGTFNHAFSPVIVGGLPNPVSVQTGDEHSCSLLGDGTIKCWGTNYTGQLGDGTIGGYSTTPVVVHGITNAIKAVPGGFHTCAILADHSVQCWGRNQDGQIGNGDSTTDVTLPVPVGGLGPVADLAAGWYHTCALMSDHSAQCWGRNARGQVGDGTVNTPITTPHRVSGLTTAIALAPGGYHTCALLQNHTVQCWGQSDYGQIGAPGLAFSATPVTVAGLANVIALDSGFFHSCAVVAGGSVWCWGDNEFGQLGNGTTTSATPLQVANVSGAISVAVGGFHSCALLQDARIQCWGENDFGEFGNGTATNSSNAMTMNGTGLTWTSSNASVATVSAGLVAAVSRGITAITATDAFGNSGATSVTVRELLTLAALKQGDGQGTIGSVPGGIDCGATCTASFASDTQVSLTATSGADSLFAGWTGCDSVSGQTCTVTMSSGRTATAIFMLKRFTLNAAKSGAGSGLVTSNPAGINCGSACASDYATGTIVSLTAAAAADSVFVGWSGCDAVSSNSCTVSINAARSVTANFDLKRFTLAVTIGRSIFGNGTVTSSPAGINCGTACAAPYVVGTTVTLTARPAVGSVFTGWGGACTGTDPVCTAVMSADKSVTANFIGLLP